MKLTTIIAFVLIVSGAMLFFYSAVSFRTPETPAEPGTAPVETTRRHVAIPIIGAFALAGGIALFIFPGKKIAP